jgi:transcriptional regulator with XRE-family HTH domain
MIKNVVQLKNAERAIESIRTKINEFNAKYSGIERDFYVNPMEIEERELLRQIEEYKKLVELPFENAVLEQGKPILIENIGELLAKLRISAKLTQKEMAMRLGWKQSNLSRFESENYSSQTINKIVEYASNLGVWLKISPSLAEEQPPIKLTVTLNSSTSPTYNIENIMIWHPVLDYLDIPRKTPSSSDYRSILEPKEQEQNKVIISESDYLGV